MKKYVVKFICLIVISILASSCNFMDHLGHKSNPIHLKQKFPKNVIIKGPNTKKISLTFDDGPDLTYTPEVLDILKQYHVKATFFLVGNRAKKHPALVKRIVQEGHSLGNHSYSHKRFSLLNAKAFHHEIEKTNETINQITGIKPYLVRPPYGNISQSQEKWLISRNYKIILWNIDSRDWKGIEADKVSKNVLNHISAGSIILFHCAGERNLRGSVRALSGIIKHLQGKHYELVPVPELLTTTNS